MPVWGYYVFVINWIIFNNDAVLYRPGSSNRAIEYAEQYIQQEVSGCRQNDSHNSGVGVENGARLRVPGPATEREPSNNGCWLKTMSAVDS